MAGPNERVERRGSGATFSPRTLSFFVALLLLAAIIGAVANVSNRAAWLLVIVLLLGLALVNQGALLFRIASLMQQMQL